MSHLKIVHKRTGKVTRTTQQKRELPRLKRLLKEHLPFLREHYHVKTIGVFGSYVRGEQGKRSDLDVLVEFDETQSMTLFKFVEMEQYLSEVLGIKVDLVMKSALKPRIGKNILNEVIPV